MTYVGGHSRDTEVAARVFVDVRSRNLPCETDENPENLQLGWPTAGLAPACLPIADPNSVTLLMIFLKAYMSLYTNIQIQYT